MQLTLAIEVQVTIVTIISMIYLLFLQTRHGIRYFLPPHDVFSSVAATAKSLQSWPTLCNPIDGSPPGSPVPGILQARTLEWVAMSFSKGWKWKVKGKSLSRVRLLATPWIAAYQAPPCMGFSRQDYWSGCHCLLRINLLRDIKCASRSYVYWYWII